MFKFRAINNNLFSNKIRSEFLLIITIVPHWQIYKYVISSPRERSLFLFFPLFSLFLPHVPFQSNYFSPEWFGLPAIHHLFLVYLLNLPASGLLFLPFPRRTWKIAVYFAAVIAFSFAELFPAYALR